VPICGVDATGLAPHERASLGVGRVFQDARLFGDLTVRETVEVALEAHEHSELVPSMLALPPSRRAERRKVQEAAEYIDFLGLGRYADRYVAELSTGTRRIVELASSRDRTTKRPQRKTARFEKTGARGLASVTADPSNLSPRRRTCRCN